ncbi:hypothetical protein H6504_00030 [Candidatus Woesearchaeota archaeon]|nr:hypothetical protein [Candidatus Woesearchaeota archaeon]
MGLTDKLAFWKKQDDDIGNDSFSSMSQDRDPFSSHNDPFSQPPPQDQWSQQNDPFAQPHPIPGSPMQQHDFNRQPEVVRIDSNQQSSQRESADLQLVLSKLDTIRAMIENINQRLSLIEEHQRKDRW